LRKETETKKSCTPHSVPCTLHNSILRIAVFASGGGTNLQALIDSFKSTREQVAKVTSRQVNKLTSRQGKVPKIVLVVSNNPKAYALKRAKKAGIETLVMKNSDFKTKREYAIEIVKELKKRKIELVCLAGFMLILDPYFIRNFRNRILNVHPALLPAFGGKGMYGHHVHEAVLKKGAKFSGCTVHFVNEIPDGGAIILQAVVPVLKNDDPLRLAKRILKFEHKIYPEAIRLYAEGKLKVKRKKVKRI